eukprot:scaffold4595_cov415-Prasinococcus_capsulatus_cf.AAC.8
MRIRSGVHNAAKAPPSSAALAPAALLAARVRQSGLSARGGSEPGLPVHKKRVHRLAPALSLSHFLLASR